MQARSGSTEFWTRFREKVPGSLGAQLSQVQQGSGEGSGECLGSFGAEPGQVQPGSREGSAKGSRILGANPTQVQRVP